MNGHPEAHRYPLGKLSNEVFLVGKIQRQEITTRIVVDQHVGSAVFSGGKKAIRALTKLLKSLED